MTAKTNWKEYWKITYKGQEYAIWRTTEGIFCITKDSNKPTSEGGYYDLWAMLKAKFPPEYIFKLQSKEAQ